jgi:lipopolysaccharide biosynthesis glycosyltransferase
MTPPTASSLRGAREYKASDTAGPSNNDIQYDIAFGLDARYAPHTAAVIASIRRYAPGARLRFLILHSGMPELRRKTIERLAPDARFIWIEVSDSDVPHYTKRPHIEHVSRATLFRLGIEKFAPPDTRRILYLDSDITVLRDVREIWNVNLHGAVVAAVTDPDVDAPAFRKRWNLPENDLGYFNAGVLLIDLERVRAERLFTAAIDFVARKNPGLADQDGLNWALWGRWHPLPVGWNLQRNVVYDAVAPNATAELRRIVKSPTIVHYTGAHKPWLPDAYHPWAWLYWDSLSRTPFLNEVARDYGINGYQRFRLWLRWLLRRA